MNCQTDEQIIELIKIRLTPKRFAHSMNVADSARELAPLYGADPQKAYTSGLLHDVMKNASPDEQFTVMKVTGVSLSSVELANRKLWHAMAGAAYVEHFMGIDDEEIIGAVRYHTTGRAGMTPLETTVYLADYISAERTYQGVEDMRILCRKSADEAIRYALEFGIPDLIKKGQVIHPDSVNLYNEVMIRRNSL